MKTITTKQGLQLAEPPELVLLEFKTQFRDFSDVGPVSPRASSQRIIILIANDDNTNDDNTNDYDNNTYCCCY